MIVSRNSNESTFDLQLFDLRLGLIQNLMGMEMFPVRSASCLTERSKHVLAQITTPKPFKTQSDVIR